jgi:hypothetical protein
MRLTFNRAGVARLLAHAQQAPRQKPSYAETAGRKAPVPALWLVGDQGVYLMSNGDPGLPSDDPKAGQGGQFVVYADQINPLTMAFDHWYQVKRRVFGGDDGVETLPADELAAALATYAPDKPLIINLNPRRMSVISYTP